MADIVIVGGGFSGTLAAIEALNRSKQTGGIDEVVLVEKADDQTGGGIAYSKVTAAAFHETNIAAKNMVFNSGVPQSAGILLLKASISAVVVGARLLVTIKASTRSTARFSSSACVLSMSVLQLSA